MLRQGVKKFQCWALSTCGSEFQVAVDSTDGESSRGQWKLHKLLHCRGLAEQAGGVGCFFVLSKGNNKQSTFSISSTSNMSWHLVLRPWSPRWSLSSLCGVCLAFLGHSLTETVFLRCQGKWKLLTLAGLTTTRCLPRHLPRFFVVKWLKSTCNWRCKPLEQLSFYVQICANAAKEDWWFLWWFAKISVANGSLETQKL